MKAQWKYIIHMDENGEELMELFGTGIIHATYAATHGIDPHRIASAGYATQDRECFGASESLSKKSRPRKDTTLLRSD